MIMRYVNRYPGLFMLLFILIQYVNTRKDLITNFRLRFNPREGNDFYLVYNDYRGIADRPSVLELPAFFNKTVMVKYIHTFTL